MFVLLEKMKVILKGQKEEKMALCLFSLFKTILYVTGSVPLHYDEIFKIKVLDCVVSMALCFSPIFFFF